MSAVHRPLSISLSLYLLLLILHFADFFVCFGWHYANAAPPSPSPSP